MLRGRTLAAVVLLAVLLVGGAMVAHFSGILNPLYHRLGWHGLMRSAEQGSSAGTATAQQGEHAGHSGMAMPEMEMPADGESHAAHPNGASDGATVWTCPMHPRIRSDQPGSCPICNMTLVPLDAAGAVAG